MKPIYSGELERRYGRFVCPACGSQWFGSWLGNPTGKTRYCHDQLGVGCKWNGTDAECGLHEDVEPENPVIFNSRGFFVRD